MTWKRVQQLTAAALLLLAVLVAWQSLQLALYTRLGPGPGLFPLALAVLLGLLAAVLLAQASLDKVGTAPPPTEEDDPATGRRRRTITVAALVGTVLLLEPLGFRLVFVAFMLVLVPVLGWRNRIATVAVALVVGFGTYEVFDEWLGVSLPTGPFGL